MKKKKICANNFDPDGEFRVDYVRAESSASLAIAIAKETRRKKRRAAPISHSPIIERLIDFSRWSYIIGNHRPLFRQVRCTPTRPDQPAGDEPEPTTRGDSKF